MFLPDLNVLVYAHREDAHDHQAYRGWLESVVNADSAGGLSDMVVSGFVRRAASSRTRRAFMPPSPVAKAMRFAEELRSRPNRIAVTPGRNHWRIFRRLCDESGTKGNLIPDAFLAAMAIEHGCEWITTDGDFARFPGLKWRHPLKS